jgi:hypothetical protein
MLRDGGIYVEMGQFTDAGSIMTIVPGPEPAE